MEALLQRIAERVGVSPPRRHLAELLGSMPEVGLDADFERQDDTVAPADVVG